MFFTTSGTEANEAALLLATSYRRSNQILALRNSYHGRSFGTVAVTGNRSWSPTSLVGLAVAYVQSSYRLRSPFRDLDDAAYTAAVRPGPPRHPRHVHRGRRGLPDGRAHPGRRRLRVPPDGYFGALKEVLDAHGILFVSDEVQTGWGRTGEHFWGYQAHGIVPDVLTFAKGVGNGLALGGVVARAEVMNCLGAHTISTFGGNPLACAGALANLDYILANDLQGNALKMGQVFFDRLGSLPERYPFVAEVRGRGLMVAVELVPPTRPVPESDPWPEAAAELLEATPPAGSADRQGRAVRQRAAHRAAAQRHRGRGRRRPRSSGSSHPRDRGGVMAILIKNGTVISSTGAIPMDVLVDGERIALLGEPGSINVSESEQTIDAAGKYVIPGGIDVHTHMELPFGGTFASDTFETGTRAAAHGGTTTIIDFAVQRTGERIEDGLAEWHAQGRRQLRHRLRLPHDRRRGRRRSR